MVKDANYFPCSETFLKEVVLDSNKTQLQPFKFLLPMKHTTCSCPGYPLSRLRDRLALP